MDITKLDIKTLKALAYDEYVKVEIATNNLKLINEELKKKNQQMVEEEKKINEKGS